MTILRLPTMYIVPRADGLIRTTYNHKRKRWQQTCTCSAYPFPHRLRGGACCGGEVEPVDEWADRGVSHSDFFSFSRWGA